jgi:hypothetical protein
MEYFQTFNPFDIGTGDVKHLSIDGLEATSFSPVKGLKRDVARVLA